MYLHRATNTKPCFHANTRHIQPFEHHVTICTMCYRTWHVFFWFTDQKKFCLCLQPPLTNLCIIFFFFYSQYLSVNRQTQFVPLFDCLTYQCFIFFLSHLGTCFFLFRIMSSASRCWVSGIFNCICSLVFFRSFCPFGCGLFGSRRLQK